MQIADQYAVTGFFYTEQGYTFRAYLNIRQKTVGVKKYLSTIKNRLTPEKPDLMVVMMNPGSSTPLAGGDDGQMEVAAKPDETQRQVMRVMERRGFKYARILNLSDLRNPSSTDFMSTIKSLDYAGIHHSIFGPQRENDFDSLFVQSVPVILAWGADDRLKPLALRALNLMKNAVKAGQRKHGSNWVYYHARQRSKSPREWVDDIVGQL